MLNAIQDAAGDDDLFADDDDEEDDEDVTENAADIEVRSFFGNFLHDSKVNIAYKASISKDK